MIIDGAVRMRPPTWVVVSGSVTVTRRSPLRPGSRPGKRMTSASSPIAPSALLPGRGRVGLLEVLLGQPVEVGAAHQDVGGDLLGNVLEQVVGHLREVRVEV